MNKAIPFWHLEGGGSTLTANGSSHNVPDGYAAPTSPFNVTVYTNGSITVTGVGGTPPYTYAWTEVGGPSGIHITNPTSQTTNWHKHSIVIGSWVGQFICTVTDSVAATATWAVDDVTIEITT